MNETNELRKKTHAKYVKEIEINEKNQYKKICKLNENQKLTKSKKIFGVHETNKLIK